LFEYEIEKFDVHEEAFVLMEKVENLSEKELKQKEIYDSRALSCLWYHVLNLNELKMVSLFHFEICFIDLLFEYHFEKKKEVNINYKKENMKKKENYRFELL